MIEGISTQEISIVSLSKLKGFLCTKKSKYNCAILDIDNLLNVVKSFKSMGIDEVAILVADSLPVMIKDMHGDSGIAIAPIGVSGKLEKILNEQISELNSG